MYEDPPSQKVASAAPLGSRSLSAYTGNYVRGIYCQSCSPDEFVRGAWPMGTPRSVKLAEGGLRIDNEVFLPTEEDDVFVRNDGKQEVFFGRDAAGEVSFFVTSFGSMVFERVVD